MTAMRKLVFAVICTIPLCVQAKRFSAVVSHITDGDTVWVRPVRGGPPQHVRINGIDAPEICQPFGGESRDALASLVLHKRVVVTAKASDDYQRTVATLRLRHEDIGKWMVAHGYAWSYRFKRDPGPYARQEAAARNARTGLWAASGAESPRDFRVRHGSCH